MNPLKVAVVGYGKLGSIHARLISESVEFDLLGIVDPNPDCRKLASDTLQIPTVANIEPLLAKIDCAIVATPTIHHYAVCKTLLENRKHVLVEKPITATIDQAAELVALAKAHNVTLQVGHVVRFDHRFQAAEKIINAPCFIECTRTSGYTFRSMDVGVTLDLMIHDIDLVLSLIDSPLTSLQALGVPVIGPHEDIAHARLTFENGAMANLTASRTSYEQIRKLQVTGASGFVAIDFMNDESITSVSVGEELRGLNLDPTNASIEMQQDIAARYFLDLLPREEISVTPGNAIKEEHTDFCAAVNTGRKPRVCGETGMHVLEVATQIVDAIHTNTANSLPVTGGPHFNPDGVFNKSGNIHKSRMRGL